MHATHSCYQNTLATTILTFEHTHSQ